MNDEKRNTHGMYDSTLAQGSGPDPRHGPGPHVMGAGTLIGNDVHNGSGEKLGDIKEIMLDVRSGVVSYAVLSFGGFMGMGEKLFAVPWAALALDTQRKCFVLDVSRERLEGAPGFDRKQWPDMADAVWERGIHDWYGTQPSPPQAVS
jgi:PRC-barrel domain